MSEESRSDPQRAAMCQATAAAIASAHVPRATFGGTRGLVPLARVQGGRSPLVEEKDSGLGPWLVLRDLFGLAVWTPACAGESDLR